jgi:DNA-binding transcriptional ArsR family regulator
VTAFDALGDPVRRRVLELLRESDLPSGTISETIGREFGITQAAVSQHLKVLRDAGLASSVPQGAKRIYHLETEHLRELDAWLEGFRGFWHGAFDKLAEVYREERKNSKDRG